MAVLDKKIQDQIDDLSNKSYDLYEAGKKEESYKIMEEAWNLYPEPKNKWNESYNTIRYAIDDLLKDAEYEKAIIWLERMEETQNNLKLWVGNFELYSGKVFFEKGDYKKALTFFKTAFTVSNGREFEGEDPKYLKFYLHPEKYTKDDK